MRSGLSETFNRLVSAPIKLCLLSGRIDYLARGANLDESVP